MINGYAFLLMAFLCSPAMIYMALGTVGSENDVQDGASVTFSGSKKWFFPEVAVLGSLQEEHLLMASVGQFPNLTSNEMLMNSCKWAILLACGLGIQSGTDETHFGPEVFNFKFVYPRISEAPAPRKYLFSRAGSPWPLNKFCATAPPCPSRVP